MWLLEFEASGMGTTVWGRLSGDWPQYNGSFTLSLECSWNDERYSNARVARRRWPGQRSVWSSQPWSNAKV